SLTSSAPKRYDLLVVAFIAALEGRYRSVARAEAVLRHQALERSSRDAGDLGRAGHVSVRASQKCAGVKALELLGPARPRFLQRDIYGHERLQARRWQRHRRSFVVSAPRRPSDGEAPLDEVAQLAHVARPCPGEQRRDELTGKRVGPTAERLVEVLRQDR